VALITGLMAMQAQAAERDLERLQDEAVEQLGYVPE